ncbi:PspC domain-containing protein [Leifsonia sp. A12D58]|uniref:PspC domain-containing protein n=1 Tax=Leifsonia sp. A12D58 TaxID=3397674 RepID=UPI0039E03566
MTNHTDNSSGTSHADGYAQITRFFDWIRTLGLVRGTDRWAAGVCGAIAGRTGLDPLIVRGIVIVLAVLGAPAILLYALAWALLPDTSGRIHAEQLVHGVVEPVTIGILALILFSLAPFNRGLWWQGAPVAWGMPDWLATTLGIGWFLAVAAAGIWLVIYLLRRTPAPDFLTKPFDSRPYQTTAAEARPAEAAPASTQAAASPSAYAFTAGAAGTTIPTPPAAEPHAATVGGNTGAYSAGAAGAAGTPPRSTWDALNDQNRAWTEQNKQRHQGNSTHMHHHRHPGAGFSAIALGLALVAGAAAAGFFTISVEGGLWTGKSLLIGLAFTLGILAIGIIVSGIRGRDSGAMGGFAFFAALALVVLGVFPQGTQFSPFGSPNWTVSSNSADAVPGYAIIAGAPTVDLSRLDDARLNDGRTIDVWLGFGETELILPTDRTVTVQSNLLAGAIDDESDQGTTRASNERGGVFFHDSRTFNSGEAGAVTEIRVWSFAGQVSIVDADTDR